jgi:hypothetical protein
MGKKKNTWSTNYELPPEPHLDDNPFLEGLFEHMNSPEGELYREVSDTLWPLLDALHVDAKRRQIIWPDGKRLNLDESVHHIQTDYPEFPRELIESRLISWLDAEYAPENYSPEQLDELDRLTEHWINDHHRRSGAR